MMAVGEILSSLEGVPYNVRELLGQRGWLVGGGLWACLAVWGAAAWAIGNLAEKRTRLGAILVLPIAVLATTASYVVLQSVASAESLDDVVGTPVLDIAPLLERWFRFVGLLATPLLAWSLGIFLASRRVARQDWPLCIAWLAGFGASYFVVVQRACTDNLTELFPNNGASWLLACLPAWMALTAWVAAVPIRMARNAAPIWRTLLVGSVLAAMSAAPAWYLASAGLNPRLEKYDATFSAMQFLLSPDRQHYVPVGGLFARFALLHLFTVGYLATSGFIYESIASSLDRVSRGGLI